MNLREAFMAAGVITPKQEKATPVKLTKQVLMWCNGHWTLGYHKHYFDGMLKEHLRQINGYRRKQVEEISIRAAMHMGEVVRVNKVAFRYKQEVSK